MSNGHSCPLFPTSSLGLREQKRKSRQIDIAIAEDSKFQPANTIVLLGISESGKSTVFRHLYKILSPIGLDVYDRSLHVLYIKKKLTEILINCLEPPPKLTNFENEEVAKWLLNNAKSILGEFHKWNFCLYREAFERSIPSLWKEPEIRRILNENKLPLNARHFLDKIEMIATDGYLSTDEEILLWPNSPPYLCTLQEHRFSNNWRLIDVNCKPMKRVFLRRLSDKTDVMFMVDFSCYSRIGESLNLFENVLSAWQREWCIVLVVFNKMDLIEEKIVSGEKLEDYFPDFLQFDCISNDRNRQVTSRMKEFIRIKFQKVAETYENLENLNIHFYDSLCSLDEEKVKGLFYVYRDLTPYKVQHGFAKI